MRLSHLLAVVLRQLDPSDFAEMPAAERQAVADLARRAADMAERRPAVHRSGVLAELKDGRPG